MHHHRHVVTEFHKTYVAAQTLMMWDEAAWSKINLLVWKLAVLDRLPETQFNVHFFGKSRIKIIGKMNI